MATKKARVVAAIALSSAVFGAASGNASADPAGSRGGDEESGLTYPELEARIEAYKQYHAEEELLACLREAKSDPGIRGTHMVGPRLKQLEVKQRLYADFRNGASELTPEDRRSVELNIVALHLERTKHIEFVRGLFANGRATTDSALLEYHDTGCISGLKTVVEAIKKNRGATPHPETP